MSLLVANFSKIDRLSFDISFLLVQVIRAENFQQTSSCSVFKPARRFCIWTNRDCISSRIKTWALTVDTSSPLCGSNLIRLVIVNTDAFASKYFCLSTTVSRSPKARFSVSIVLKFPVNNEEEESQFSYPTFAGRAWYFLGRINTSESI